MKLNKNVTSVCPICGSEETGELYPSDINLKKLSFSYVKTPDSNKTFRSVRCNMCSHVFCSPLPIDMYRNYEDVVDQEYLNYTESISKSSDTILAHIKKYAPRGKLLDIGCATGEFLEKAKKAGYDVEGLELSAWSTAIARKKGLTIHRHRLKPLSKKFVGKYDVITLFGVIEHFESPIDELSSISKLLKPGGLLVIWTGDVNSLPSRVLGKSWWYWQGQHIQYFTEKSLSLLAKNAGIDHITTKTYPFVATRDLLDNSLSRYGLRKFFMMVADPFFLLKPNWTFYIPGEMLWFGRKKRSKRKMTGRIEKR